MGQKYNWRGRVRLFSGLTLFTFLLTHLLNHSLGIVSLEVLEQGRWVFLAFWRNPFVSAVLLAALLAHLSLGLEKVLRLPTWRMPRWEFTQIALGLLIPIQVLPNVTVTRILHDAFGVEDSYAFVLRVFWSWWAIPQLLLVVVAWTHGCIGLHFWLRFRPIYARIAPGLLGLAVAIPLLAAVGFWRAGSDVARLAADPAWLAARAAAERWPDAAFMAQVNQAMIAVALGTAGTIAAWLLLRGLLKRQRRARAGLIVHYGNGARVRVPRGTTVLQASRLAGIPHASICGGRGRCSTCRVRVNRGLELLQPPNSDEQRVLKRIGAPPNVRLACQIRPSGDIHVTPLLPPLIRPVDTWTPEPHRHGRELEVAIVFTDLRGFTRLTEQQLAYDVVFLLNQYFRAMGEAIEAEGGKLVQVFGDGIMALFGLECGAEEGTRQALRAAKGMAHRLDTLNRERPVDLGEPLRMGIGIHCGAAVVGEMGYHDAIVLTAVGLEVNSASRLEEATKAFECQLVVSQHAAGRAGLDASPWPLHNLDVRGRSGTLPVRAIPSAKDLPELEPLVPKS